MQPKKEKKYKRRGTVARTKLDRFTERVLMINLPTAVCLLLLVMIDELAPFTAVFAFGTIVMVSILIIIPFMEQLQSVTDYSRNLVKSINEGKEVPAYKGEVLGAEYSEIIEAMNKLHNVWVSKDEEGNSAYLSDAALLDILPDPLVLLGAGGEVVGANLAARELFGETVRNKTLKALFPQKEQLVPLMRVLGGKEKALNAEYKTEENPCHILTFRAERLPAKAHSGAVAAIAFHDVTEIRNLEQMQADFVANASHELRTPLAVISGFIEMLQGAAKDDKAAAEKFLGIMGEQSERMSKLIENLLSLSRIQMQREVPDELVDIKELILGLVIGMENQAQKRKMTLKNMTRKTALVKGAASEISQVLQNLIDNAVKYGTEGQAITVSSENVEDKVTGRPMVAVAVHNFGEVIPEAEIPRLCERFYRVDTKQTRNRSGSGLGLAIVDRILKRHKGRLEITSVEQAGTTFVVYLPAAK